MSTVESYRDLIVWQKSIRLTIDIYKETRKFPKEELFGLTSQIRRCAVSIPSNIAEGQARNTSGEFVQFIGIAKGSLAELETQIEISFLLDYFDEITKNNLIGVTIEINKMLTALQTNLPNKKK